MFMESASDIPARKSSTSSLSSKSAPKREDRKARYATVRHPSIEAAVKALYRFEKHSQAQSRLNSIAQSFILSRKHMPVLPEGEEPKPLKEVILWIRGFFLTDQDEQKGALGHFGRVFIHEMQDGRYTLKAEKLPVEIKFHPQKRRLPSKHPNWGHPVLRSVLKARPYPTVEAAAQALQMLHEEYPEVSIPTGNKLYIITYGKGAESGKPVQKVVLEIKLQPDGSCLIESQDNKKPFLAKEEKAALKAAETSDAPLDAASGENAPEEASKPAKQQQGYYTGLVELRRKKKKRTVVPRPAKPAEE